MRIFSIAAAVCIIVILPLNYFGKEMRHPEIHSESLDVFTIGNVEKGSRWLWVHCLALYIITFSACILLYLEYKSIARRRLVYITRGPTNSGPFTVLVRAIPKSTEESFSDSVRNIFKEYYASSYLSHQMIYKVGKVHKVMNSTENVFKKLVITRAIAFNQKYQFTKYRCGLCEEASDTHESYSNDYETSTKNSNLDQSNSNGNEKQECSAAFVFFKTRYAAVVASQVLQSSNPMSWVTDLAPEPRDVYWSNLWIPFKQLWLRRIAALLASFHGFVCTPCRICTKSYATEDIASETPIFERHFEEDIMEADQEDEQSGKMKQTHELLLSSYRQFPPDHLHESKDKENKESGECDLKDGLKELEEGLGDPALPDLMHLVHMGLPVSMSQGAITSLTTLVSNSDRNSPKRDAGMSTL